MKMQLAVLICLAIYGFSVLPVGPPSLSSEAGEDFFNNCLEITCTRINPLSVCEGNRPAYFPWRLYPYLYDVKPAIASPALVGDTLEAIVVVTKNGQFGIADVTMEDGKPLLYSYKAGTFWGKDKQTLAGPDFPVLVKTGLHSLDELETKERITGIPVDVINCTAKPGAYSYTGFLAEDEDLLSVLKGDNQLVKAMGLTHPQLAKPLFHTWNLILKEIELNKWPDRHYNNITSIYYNGHRLSFHVSGSKGWQNSIFFDEIQGRHHIYIDRKLLSSEASYLESHYSQLNDRQLSELKQRLTRLDFSEMLPYYIMRYGFYEGHVDYRCDPLAVAFIFGLKTLEELDAVCGGRIYQRLMTHFTEKRN